MSTPSPSAVVSRPAESGLRAWLAGNPHLRMFETLVRREFWEHRSLWRGPLVVSVLLLVCAVAIAGNVR